MPLVLEDPFVPRHMAQVHALTHGLAAFTPVRRRTGHRAQAAPARRVGEHMNMKTHQDTFEQAAEEQRQPIGLGCHELPDVMRLMAPTYHTWA